MRKFLIKAGIVALLALRAVIAIAIGLWIVALVWIVWSEFIDRMDAWFDKGPVGAAVGLAVMFIGGAYIGLNSFFDPRV